MRCQKSILLAGACWMFLRYLRQVRTACTPGMQLRTARKAPAQRQGMPCRQPFHCRRLARLGMLPCTATWSLPQHPAGTRMTGMQALSSDPPSSSGLDRHGVRENAGVGCVNAAMLCRSNVTDAALQTLLLLHARLGVLQAAAPIRSCKARLGAVQRHRTCSIGCKYINMRAVHLQQLPPVVLSALLLATDCP
jgi:hypothetical protein